MVTKSQAHRPHNCICDQCLTSFYKTPSLIKKSINNFCSIQCRGLFNRKRVIVQCNTCGIDFEKHLCYVARTDKSFCSAECYYKYPDKIKRLPVHRSKAEDYLYDLLEEDFPNLEIKKNDTELLDGLEVDILIPSKKIAIELNGPVHYTDIYGIKNLEKTLERDERKLRGLEDLNYRAVIVNISPYKNLNQAKPRIHYVYDWEIKPFITV